MKKIIITILVVSVLSCKSEKDKIITDNIELSEIHEQDQLDRQTRLDWSKVNKRDSVRRVRVHQLLDSNKVVTAKDYKHAAMVFQHGNGPEDYGLAVELMEKAIALDSTINKWLLAATTDRYLLSKGEPQIYGTQYRKMNGGPWKLADIDTTKISDKQRIKFGVETLAEQREKERDLNRKELSMLLDSVKSIDKVITYIKKSDKTKSSYNVSERGINTFGYYLLGKEKNEEALKIFKLNTELYPEAYNTHDSYGECLLKIGNKEKAIEAYEKSLELNSNNNNAKKVLESLR